nr:amino acid transporter, transmembrane [Tanacetum cinerariifolium]
MGLYGWAGLGSLWVDSKNLLDRVSSSKRRIFYYDVLDSPCSLVLITETSQSRQHDSIKNITSHGKITDSVEGIISRLSLLLVRKMCSTLQEDGAGQVHTDTQFHVQHLLRKLETSFALEVQSKIFDDDGRPKRTGTVWTASAHIISAGSGVLSFAWPTTQLRWIARPTVLFLFSFVTCYTSCLLATCYWWVSSQVIHSIFQSC